MSSNHSGSITKIVIRVCHFAFLEQGVKVIIIHVVQKNAKVSLCGRAAVQYTIKPKLFED